jgi:hypothetical protein
LGTELPSPYNTLSWKWRIVKSVLPYQTQILLDRAVTISHGFGAHHPESERKTEQKMIIKMNVCDFAHNSYWADSPLVYQVNWPCARAQRNCWAEELNLTKHEMQWTVKWYIHMATRWKDHQDATVNVSRRHVTYAEKQMAMWNELGKVSDLIFSKSNRNHPSVWQLVM